jgi:translocation and assembly module TamA
MPTGHRFRSDLQLSFVESAVAARYEIPIRSVATDRLDFDVAARQVDIGDAESTQYSTSANERVSWRGFRRRLYLQLQREEFQFGTSPTQVANLLFPGVTLNRERSNDMLYPTAGYSVQLDLRGGTSQVVSDVSFVRLKADARWVRAVAGNTRLLLRAEAGALRDRWLWRAAAVAAFFHRWRPQRARL